MPRLQYSDKATSSPFVTMEDAADASLHHHTATRLSFLLLLVLLTALLPLSSCNRVRAMDKLARAERLVLPTEVGPESLAFDRHGRGPYTGVSGGRILVWRGKHRRWARFAVNSANSRKLLNGRKRECDEGGDGQEESVCGRPLGVQFHKATGVLYVADAYRGLLAVGPRGGVARLIAAAADYGGPFNFTNGLDVDQRTGAVYFTDSSTVFQRRDYIMAVITGDSTGRLMKYDPRTKRITVLKHGLPFPNGVALSDDGAFLVYAETGSCRLVKYWLRGPHAGATEVFSELPGYPDNVRRTLRGDYWVALNSEKIDLKKTTSGERIGAVQQAAGEHAVAVRLSREGRVMEVLDGGELASVSEVVEENGTLWVGSVELPYVDAYKI